MSFLVMGSSLNKVFCFKAQYLIFEKIREDGYGNGSDARLTVEVVIPSSQVFLYLLFYAIFCLTTYFYLLKVGRIIGKGGATVKELQRATNASIKLPEQLQTVLKPLQKSLNSNYLELEEKIQYLYLLGNNHW